MSTVSLLCSKVSTHSRRTLGMRSEASASRHKLDMVSSTVALSAPTPGANSSRCRRRATSVPVTYRKPLLLSREQKVEPWLNRRQDVFMLTSNEKANVLCSAL